MSSSKNLIKLGALLAALGVALGAFAAHGLRDVIAADMLANFETGARYHLIHAVALVAIGAVAGQFKLPGWVSWAFIIGIFFFSGSLCLMAVTGMRWLGAVTPIGGVAFIAGWLGLAWRVFKAAA